MASFNNNSSMCYISKAPIDFISPPFTPDQHDGSAMKSLHLGALATDHFKEAVKKSWASPVQIQALPPSPPALSFDTHSSYLTYNTATVPGCSEGSVSSDNSESKAASVSTYSHRRKQKTPYRSLPRTVEGSFEMPMIISSSTAKAKELTGPHQPRINGGHTTSNHVFPAKKRNYSSSHCIEKDCVTIDDQQLKPSTTTKKPRKNSAAKQTAHYDSNKPNHISAMTSNETNTIRTSDTTDNSKTSTTGSTSPDIQNEDGNDNGQSSLISKKSKTEAALVFDNLSADSDLAALFAGAKEWIPSVEVFSRRPHVRIHWKGSPLKIKNMPHYEKLHPGEVYIAATLRLTPEQYLKCKWALILAAKKASEENTLFRKSEAQKVCCIDVNKTSVLWNTFGKLGWLGSKWPQ